MKQVRNNGVPETEKGILSRTVDRFNTWRLGITVDAETIVKAAVIAFLLVFFTLTQTTLLTRFRLFGAIPDILLPFVIAVGILEKEKWGAVFALVAAFVIDAAGGTTVTLLPLLYVPAAVICALLTTSRLRDSFTVNAVFTAVSSVVRGMISFAVIMLTVHGITPRHALLSVVLPEIAANILIAAVPQLITRAVLRPFHKTRAERTGEEISLKAKRT